jgi:triosephosphate isomerase (TIM)
MRKLVAANWKMNGLKAGGAMLARDLALRATSGKLASELVICPPATLLIVVAEALKGSPIGLGGQDCHAEDKGAHTGDISAAMLKDAGCRYVILGHSERRAEHHESDADVCAKLAAARKAGLAIILCVGESETERQAGKTRDVVEHQLTGSLPPGLAGLDASNLAVAYEPVWAIGSGRTPTPAEVSEIHAGIRQVLGSRLREVRILYGGSVKPQNARDLMTAPEVDGALVGGASLMLDDFWAIARACG